MCLGLTNTIVLSLEMALNSLKKKLDLNSLNKRPNKPLRASLLSVERKMLAKNLR